MKKLKLFSLFLFLLIGAGNLWATDYELTTSITDGDYVIGCIKGAAGTDNVIRAIKAEKSGNWGAYITITPSKGKISNPDASVVWTLHKISNNSFSLKNGNNYYVITTGTDKNSVALSTSSSTIYFAAIGNSTDAFELSGVSSFTVSSGNQLGCNQGSGFGYRQYAQRAHGTGDTDIATQIRFYKKVGTTKTTHFENPAKNTTSCKLFLNFIYNI